MARPRRRYRGGARACWRCSAAAACRSARCSASSSAASQTNIGAPHASAVSSGTAGLHLALRAVGCQRRRRGRSRARSRSWLRRTSPVSSARGRSSPTSTPVTLTLDPAAAAAAVDPAMLGLLPVPSSVGRPTWRRSSRSACRSSRTPARRSALATPTASPVGSRGHPAVFAFYANKQITTGEGGIVTLADAALKERIDSERNQGRAPNMDWLDHDRLGFNYRLSRPRLRARPGPARAARRDARGARPGRGALRRGARSGSRGSSCRAPTPAARVRGWFVYVVLLPRGVDRDGSCARCASAASRASPTCLRST